MLVRNLVVAGVCLLGISWIAAAEKPNVELACDWDHFNGPNSDASSPEKGLLRQWPEGGPKVLWKAKTGRGWSCPSVAGNDVVVCSRVGKEWKESVACLNLATGAERWNHTYEVEPYWKAKNCGGWSQGGVTSTPAISDKYVCAIGRTGEMHCLDRATGTVKWRRSLSKDWDAIGIAAEKGYSFSPLIADGKVLVHMGRYGEGKPTTVAIDLETGKDAWMFSRPDNDDKGGSEGHTPALVTINGEKCVLFASAVLRAVRVSDGKQIWCEHENLKSRGRGIPTPLLAGNIMVMQYDFEGCRAIEADFSNAAAGSKQLWKLEFPYSIYHNFVHQDGYLYGLFERLDKDSTVIPLAKWEIVLYCMDLKTGKKVWEQPGFKSGLSFTLADGLIFAREANNLHLFEATPKGFSEKGKLENMHAVSNADMSDHACVTPVLSHGKLFVRCPDELWCLDVADEAARAKLQGSAQPAKPAAQAAPPKPAPQASRTERLLKLAQEMERAGQKEAARQSYEQIVKDAPNEPQAAVAKERLSMLK
ncbi:MAG: PQQ-binding-like beta-propeller repeat protein [Planctomycetota bacterium]|nr:PQQ-binding-like beta-propeller repeat protein [Planctomycetota bacterium]